jgi:hypothetical protein
VVRHDHAIDEVGCQPEDDDEEDKLETASDEECGADRRGSVRWDLHSEESETGRCYVDDMDRIW